MSVSCQHCREQMLDYLYGLLDPADESAVASHLETCPTCAAARADASDVRTLFAKAAKAPFPDVTFVPPADAVPSEQVRKRAARASQWVLAAGILLAVGVFGTSLIRDAVNLGRAHDDRTTAQADLDAAQQVKKQRDDDHEKLIANLKEELKPDHQTHERIIKDWVSREVSATRPFKLQVTGPVSAVPGGTNGYVIDVTTKDGQAVSAAIAVAVRDDKGNVYHEQTLEPKAGPQKVTLPLQLWAKLPDGLDTIRLSVTATDATGAKAELQEPIRLLAPVFVTHLSTDKPLYRRGETVYFRTTTLDKARQQPPAVDRTIRFELRKPNGEVAFSITGATQPVSDQNGKPVLGPDGQPVRGIATGAYTLPDTLSLGEYTLIAYDLPAGWVANELPPGAKPIAAQKLTLAEYVPDRLQKTLDFDKASYAAGDLVTVKVVVKDQGQLYVGKQYQAEARHGSGKDIKCTPAFGVLDAAGSATIKFKLPADVTSPTITVTIHDQNAEAITKPVPLTTGKIMLELFPEGGELLQGVPNRVYVRATRSDGRPVDIVGTVSNGSKTVADVKTLTDPDNPGVNQGLGVFTFTPEAGQRYAVKLLRPAGLEEPALTVEPLAKTLRTGYALPKAEPDGVALSIPTGVLETRDPIRITLTAGETPREVVVGAYCRGTVIGHKRLTLPPRQPTNIEILPTQTAIGGVTRVTVFEDAKGAAGRTDLLPLAERLIFRRPFRHLNLTVDTHSPGPFSPGEAVKLTVRGMNERQEPVPAVVWAAVVNQSVVTMADDRTERSFPTHVQLGGEIQNPERLENADFLLTRHPKAAEALDLLLGTQGWRRFAEVDGRFRSTAVSDADQQQFWISTGRGVAELPIDGTTDRFLPAVAPLTDKVLDTEADVKRLERERATQPPDVVAHRSRVASAESRYRTAREQLTSNSFDLLIVLLVVAIIAAIVRYRPNPSGRISWVELLVVITIIVITIGLLLPSVQKVRSTAAKTAQNATMLPAEMMSPRGPDDSREVAMLRPQLVTPAAMPQRRPTSNVKTLTRSAVPPGPPPPSDAADLAERSYREQPTTAEEQAALAKVKQRLTRHPRFVVREYAQPAPKPTDDPTRTDFTETVLWKPVVILPDTGIVDLNFHLSDAVSPYRVLIAGHTLDGRIGAVSRLIEVRKPLVLEPKLPAELSTTDRLDLPLTATNGTDRPLTVKLDAWSDSLTATGETAGTLELPANGGGRRVVTFRANTPGAGKVRVSGSAGPHTDAVERTVRIVPEGFPVAGSINHDLKTLWDTELKLPGDLVPGTLRVRLSFFANSMVDVQSGLEGMIREPYGCFEQTSSVNYPNILALRYLKDTNRADAGLADRASAVLDRGYNRLLGFEVRAAEGTGKAGFEWFGAFPAHEALTAYGLVQFADMLGVYPVDPKVIDRTRQFLLARRTGTGGFARKQDFHSFGNVPESVTNAYIVWALRQADRITGTTTDLDREAKAAADEAAASGDPYRLALTAHGDKSLLDQLAKKQQTDGSVPGAEATITRSWGNDVVTETTAFAALAWLAGGHPEHRGPVANAIAYLVGRRSPHGTFGGTQATVLALKAIVAFNEKSRKPFETGELTARLGDSEIGRVTLRNDELRPIIFEVTNPDDVFRTGSQRLTVATTLKQPYAVSLSWEAMTRRPTSAENAPLRLTTALSRTTVPEGESTRLTVTVQNREGRDTGMAVAVVGIPAGLKLPVDGKQFVSLMSGPNGLGYWEQNGRELILYWRGLGPKQTVEIPIELIADVPGEFRGPASRAYLYYGAEAKHWIEPLAVTVTPR